MIDEINKWLPIIRVACIIFLLWAFWYEHQMSKQEREQKMAGCKLDTERNTRNETAMWKICPQRHFHYTNRARCATDDMPLLPVTRQEREQLEDIMESRFARRMFPREIMLQAFARYHMQYQEQRGMYIPFSLSFPMFKTGGIFHLDNEQVNHE